MLAMTQTLESPRRVLVVDDDADVLAFASQGLRAHYDVTAVTSGSEALAAFRDGPFAVLLCDVRMPGIDGIQLLKTIRQIAPRCEVILMSGQADMHMVMEGMNHGALAFVTKPLELDAVCRRIDQAITQVRSYEDQARVIAELKRDLLLQTAFAQRLSALAALSGSIGHELAQPLSGISMYTETLQALVREGAAGEAAVSELVGKIHHQIARATDVIDHIRRLTTDDREGPAEALDLREVVERALDLFRAQLQSRGIDLRVAVPGDLTLQANRSLLEQVLINLVANARDSLEIRAAREPAHPREILVRAGASDGRLHLEVADTGVGLEPGMPARLFEPFVTTKHHQGGSGLGLFICRQIARRMGGELELTDSSPGGATFRLQLPRGGIRP